MSLQKTKKLAGQTVFDFNTDKLKEVLMNSYAFSMIDAEKQQKIFENILRAPVDVQKTVFLLLLGEQRKMVEIEDGLQKKYGFAFEQYLSDLEGFVRKTVVDSRRNAEDIARGEERDKEQHLLDKLNQL